MENRPLAIIDRQHPLVQLFLLTALCLTGGIVLTLLAYALSKPLFGVVGIDKVLLDAEAHPEQVMKNAAQVNALRLIQLFSSIGTFLLPAFLFSLLKSFDKDFFNLRKRVNLLMLLLAIIIVPLSSPLISLIYEWNQHLSLPASLQKNIEAAEKGADALTKIYLYMPDVLSLVYMILLMGIIPADSEELIFRGCLMHIFTRWSGSRHTAIWVSAAVFSFIHFQFFGFVPRMLLGAMFGYLYYWSGTLWVPIIAHLITNGAQVVLSYLFQHGAISYNVDADTSVSPLVIILSAVLVTGALWLFYRKSKQDHLALSAGSTHENNSV